MKPVIAIALLACGVVLICVPPVADHLLRKQIILSGDTHRVGGPDPYANYRAFAEASAMPDLYRAGCFLAGLAMIGVAIAGSWDKRERGFVAGREQPLRGLEMPPASAPQS